MATDVSLRGRIKPELDSREAENEADSLVNIFGERFSKWTPDLNINWERQIRNSIPGSGIGIDLIKTLSTVGSTSSGERDRRERQQGGGRNVGQGILQGTLVELAQERNEMLMALLEMFDEDYEGSLGPGSQDGGGGSGLLSGAGLLGRLAIGGSSLAGGLVGGLGLLAGGLALKGGQMASNRDLGFQEEEFNDRMELLSNQLESISLPEIEEPRWVEDLRTLDFDKPLWINDLMSFGEQTPTWLSDITSFLERPPTWLNRLVEINTPVWVDTLATTINTAPEWIGRIENLLEAAGLISGNRDGSGNNNQNNQEPSPRDRTFDRSSLDEDYRRDQRASRRLGGGDSRRAPGELGTTLSRAADAQRAQERSTERTQQIDVNLTQQIEIDPRNLAQEIQRASEEAAQNAIQEIEQQITRNTPLRR